MDFPSTMGAARICYSHGGKRFWMVKPLSLEGHAILLQWLDDVLPGREERKMPPSPSSDEAKAAMDSPTGKALMIWLALRDHGLNEEQAAAISDSMTARGDEGILEHFTFVRALQTHRRTALPGEPAGKGIESTWCEKGMAELVRTIGLEAVKSLSMDQFEWLMQGGDLDAENPEFSPESLAEKNAKFHAEELPKLLEAMKEQGIIIPSDPPSGPAKAAEMSITEELAAMGLRIKPGDES